MPFFSRTTLFIFLSFMLAIMLTMIPLPVWAQPYRPEWVALVLFYWSMHQPERVGVISGWSVGLLLDVVRGTLLGQYALILALIAYFTVRFAIRLRNYHPLRQMFILLFMVIFIRLESLWVHGIIGVPLESDLYFWIAALVTMLLWPWLQIILRDIERKLDLS
ncbi:MAG: rod shape-determining protein MreD [Gammaproteobacteria bacterium]|nr:rod shape-determining protein MreD [Gammaproteobacteria bacterium]